MLLFWERGREGQICIRSTIHVWNSRRESQYIPIQRPKTNVCSCSCDSHRMLALTHTQEYRPHVASGFLVITYCGVTRVLSHNWTIMTLVVKNMGLHLLREEAVHLKWGIPEQWISAWQRYYTSNNQLCSIHTSRHQSWPNLCFDLIHMTSKCESPRYMYIEYTQLWLYLPQPLVVPRRVSAMIWAAWPLLSNSTPPLSRLLAIALHRRGEHPTCQVVIVRRKEPAAAALSTGNCCCAEMHLFLTTDPYWPVQSSNVTRDSSEGSWLVLESWEEMVNSDESSFGVFVG